MCYTSTDGKHVALMFNAYSTEKNQANKHHPLFPIGLVSHMVN